MSKLSEIRIENNIDRYGRKLNENLITNNDTDFFFYSKSVYIAYTIT